MPTGQPILTHPWDPTHSALVVKGWGAEHTWNQPRGVKHLNQGSWGGSEKASTEPTVKDVLGSGARRTGEPGSPSLTLSLEGHGLNNSSESFG